MQPNVIVVDAIGHRPRFFWLGALLAVTVAAFLVSAMWRHDHERTRALAQQRAERAERAMWVQHRCHKARYHAERAAERARRARPRADVHYD